MGETRDGRITPVTVAIRPAWGEACETLAVDVGHASALVVVVDEDEDGSLSAMSIDATGPEDLDALIEWLRMIATALEGGARLDD